MMMLRKNKTFLLNSTELRYAIRTYVSEQVHQEQSCSSLVLVSDLVTVAVGSISLLYLNSPMLAHFKEHFHLGLQPHRIKLS